MKPVRLFATLTVYEQILLGTRTPTSNSAEIDTDERITICCSWQVMQLTLVNKCVGTSKNVGCRHVFIRVKG